MTTGKPHFNNHPLIKEQMGKYAVVSCYNNLPIGGGSHTLVRLNLFKLAKKAKGLDDFMNNLLPEGVKAGAEVINKRAEFLVEQTNFFSNRFFSGRRTYRFR